MEGAGARHSPLLAPPRFGFLEALPWALALAAYFLFPSYLSFGSGVLIMALFALSLDLALGYAGILTLGHAIFFGTGAYTAGLLALGGWREPITGALASGGLSAVLAVVVGFLVLHLHGLPQIMTTLAFGVIFYEVANKLTSVTGGDDGLQGIKIDPLFGVFDWTVYGHTAYLYALGWLLLLFLVARRLAASPFGLALQGIRINPLRMQMVGSPIALRLMKVFVISGFMAGVAGAVSAQTTKFVGLDVYSLNTSAAVLVMLVLGGLGRLYGAILGTAVYMIVHHVAAVADPYNWMFVIGALLIGVVLLAQGGLLGVCDRVAKRLARRK